MAINTDLNVTPYFDDFDENKRRIAIYAYMLPRRYKIKLPEKIINYPEMITIRSNWDLELDWESVIAK